MLVPQFRFRGQNATLLCKYELEKGEDLYSLKWYKEDVEFYRFLPPEPQPRHRQHYQRSQQQYSRHYNNNNNYGHHRQPYEDYPQPTKVAKPQEGTVRTWPVPGIKINVRNKELLSAIIAITLCDTTLTVELRVIPCCQIHALAA